MTRGGAPPPLSCCPWARRAGRPAAAVALAVLCAVAGVRSLPAVLVPSPELSFRVTLTPDSISVGDPIRLKFEATGPAGAALVLPQLADSIEGFVVLRAEPPKREVKGGRVEETRAAEVTLFRAALDTLPALPLLWPRDGGDTLVAWSRPLPVRVGSVLTGAADLSNLKDLKRPVALSRSLWWVWVLAGLAAAALGFWLIRMLRARRGRRRGAVEESVPALPPDVVFEQGLAALRAARLPEQGCVREYYFELSFLLRRYLEGRFGFPAVEETRMEIVASAGRVAALEPEERESLARWLAEGELVKFARQERLLAEADSSAEEALRWVRRTAAPREVEIAAAPASVSGGPPAPKAEVSP